MRLDETTRTYSRGLAGSKSARGSRSLPCNPLTQANGPRRKATLLGTSCGTYSMIRTSLSPNVLKAGFRANVIPSEAEALIDIRALPDEELPSSWSGCGRLSLTP